MISIHVLGIVAAVAGDVTCSVSFVGPLTQATYEDDVIIVRVECPHAAHVDDAINAGGDYVTSTGFESMEVVWIQKEPAASTAWVLAFKPPMP